MEGGVVLKNAEGCKGGRGKRLKECKVLVGVRWQEGRGQCGEMGSVHALTHPLARSAVPSLSLRVPLFVYDHSPITGQSYEGDASRGIALH